MRYRRFLRVCPLALAGLLVMVSVEPTSAKLYKWVDENGNVTYSERKPPNQKVEEIKVRSAPVTPSQAEDQLETLKEKTDTQREDRGFAEAAAKESKTEVEQFKKNCEIARQNRRVLQNSSRIQDQDSQGNTYFLEPGQIQAKLEQTNKQIQLYCK